MATKLLIRISPDKFKRSFRSGSAIL